ncbi:MAG: PASTA domain-containing protein [Gemmatimonadota bacterium]
MALAVSVGAFLVGYGISALSFTRGTAPTDVVLVPDVRTMELAQAEREMARAGLESAVSDSFPNPEVAAGAVLTQTPLPGQEVSPGVEVQLIVSTGRARPSVPEVEAMPLTLATRALQTAGFDVLVEQDSAPGDLGRVVGVEPPAGTPLELPATVRLRIGGGYRIVEMPMLVGMQEERARETIEELGLEVGSIEYEEVEADQPGDVVEQRPAPGDSVATGSAVELRVSAPSRRGVIRGRLGSISEDEDETGAQR